MIFSSKDEPLNALELIFNAQQLINKERFQINLYEELTRPENHAKGYTRIIEVIQKYINLIDTYNKILVSVFRITFCMSQNSRTFSGC